MGSHWVKVLAMAVGSLWAVGAQAQATSENQVAAMTNWSVFEHKETDKRECWAVSTATESVNTRDGQVVAVNRSDVLLMVSYVPAANAQGQVGFTGGYPFAGGSTVTMKIGDTNYALITDGEWAWPASAGDDAEIVSAMKRGSEATLTATSSRGTKTADTFSLLGFTAAVEDAGKRCK